MMSLLVVANVADVVVGVITAVVFDDDVVDVVVTECCNCHSR